MVEDGGTVHYSHRRIFRECARRTAKIRLVIYFYEVMALWIVAVRKSLNNEERFNFSEILLRNLFRIDSPSVKYHEDADDPSPSSLK